MSICMGLWHSIARFAMKMPCLVGYVSHYSDLSAGALYPYWQTGFSFTNLLLCQPIVSSSKDIHVNTKHPLPNIPWTWYHTSLLHAHLCRSLAQSLADYHAYMLQDSLSAPLPLVCPCQNAVDDAPSCYLSAENITHRHANSRLLEKCRLFSLWQVKTRSTLSSVSVQLLFIVHVCKWNTCVEERRAALITSILQTLSVMVFTLSFWYSKASLMHFVSLFWLCCVPVFPFLASYAGYDRLPERACCSASAQHAAIFLICILPGQPTRWTQHRVRQIRGVHWAQGGERWMKRTCLEVQKHACTYSDAAAALRLTAALKAWCQHQVGQHSISLQDVRTERIYCRVASDLLQGCIWSNAGLHLMIPGVARQQKPCAQCCIWWYQMSQDNKSHVNSVASDDTRCRKATKAMCTGLHLMIPGVAR